MDPHIGQGARTGEDIGVTSTGGVCGAATGGANSGGIDATAIGETLTEGMIGASARALSTTGSGTDDGSGVIGCESWNPQL